MNKEANDIILCATWETSMHESSQMEKQSKVKAFLWEIQRTVLVEKPHHILLINDITKVGWESNNLMCLAEIHIKLDESVPSS